MEQNKSSKSTRRRVKVYHLADKGEWEDKGTGHVDILYMEKLGCSGMVVKSEKGEEILLETKIYKPEIYQLQQDTLIVWTDPETDTELALSFQEAGGCKDIWDQIAGPDEGNEEPGYDLPSPSLSNLQKTCDIFSEPMTLYKKEKISLSLLRNNYIRKWFEVFSICEDLEDIEHLKMFFVLFKSIVILNDPSVLEYLLAPENVFDFMGTLEYDPDISKPVHHREYLKNQVVFKEVVPFENNNLVNKIHQTYRIIYLKDTVLPRALDDATYSTLNSLIFFNNVDIVSQIQSDTRFLSEVFRRIKSTDTNHNDLKDLISFIQELCNLAKALQIQNRVAFYQNLSKYGFCDIFEIALAVPLSPVRNSIVNILESVLGHDPGFLRSYILSQKPNYTFLNILIDVFIHDSEMGLRVQLSEILRVLIDTSNMEESADKDNFLTMFYSECIEKIVEPITEDKVSSSNELSMVKESICDILAFCIVHHSYRIKNFLLRQNVAENVVKLANIRDKPLTLAVVRFFRAFVGMKDEFYNRHIIKHELFGPLLKVFIENGSKYNLLNSAILELFDFIKKENIKLLVQHIAEKYRKDLESIKYVDTFTSLFLKFDQSQEDPTTPSTPPQGVKDAPSKEEDEYFSESTEEESPAAEPTNANNISSEPPPSHKRESKDDDDIQQSPRLLKKSKISINLKSASLVPNSSEDTQNDSKGSKVE